MVNQQLLEYVRAQRTAGLSKEDIIKAAAAGGWTPADLEEIFMALDGTPKPATPPTPPAPPPAPMTPPAPRVITPPPAAARAPLQPITPAAMSAAPRPAMAASEIATAPAVKKHSVWPYVLLVVLVLLAALAFAGYYFIWPSISDALAPAATPAEQPAGEPLQINTDTSSANFNTVPTSPDTTSSAFPATSGTSSETAAASTSAQ